MKLLIINHRVAIDVNYIHYFSLYLTVNSITVFNFHVILHFYMLITQSRWIVSSRFCLMTINSIITANTNWRTFKTQRKRETIHFFIKTWEFSGELATVNRNSIQFINHQVTCQTKSHSVNELKFNSPHYLKFY